LLFSDTAQNRTENREKGASSFVGIHSVTEKIWTDSFLVPHAVLGSGDTTQPVSHLSNRQGHRHSLLLQRSGGFLVQSKPIWLIRLGQKSTAQQVPSSYSFSTDLFKKLWASLSQRWTLSPNHQVLTFQHHTPSSPHPNTPHSLDLCRETLLEVGKVKCNWTSVILGPFHS
jgi:hypothetical protein